MCRDCLGRDNSVQPRATDCGASGVTRDESVKYLSELLGQLDGEATRCIVPAGDQCVSDTAFGRKGWTLPLCSRVHTANVRSRAAVGGFSDCR